MSDDAVREHLLWMLGGGQAHMSLEQAVAGFPLDQINDPFPNGEYGAWALIEHIRRGQWDILDFIRNPEYVEIKWPDDYWPDRAYKATAADWHATLDAIAVDRRALADIVRDPATDLYDKIAHGSGQTVMREIMLVCDHDAYHIGEFAIMRQVAQNWPAERDTP